MPPSSREQAAAQRGCVPGLGHTARTQNPPTSVSPHGAPPSIVGYRVEHVGAPQGQTLALCQLMGTRQDTSRRARRLPLMSSLGTEQTRQADYLLCTEFLNCTLKTQREERHQPGKRTGELGQGSQNERLREGGGEDCRELGAPRTAASTRGARSDEDRPGGKVEGVAAPLGVGRSPPGGTLRVQGAFKGRPKQRPCWAVSGKTDTDAAVSGRDCGFHLGSTACESGHQPSLKRGQVQRRGGRRTEATLTARGRWHRAGAQRTVTVPVQDGSALTG